MNQGKQLISNFKFYSGNYSFYKEDKGRYETWNEAVSDRVMAMHKRKYQQQLSNSKKLREYVDFAEKAYLEKLVLGSQRALQFGGRDIEKHESKMYNCLTSYADRVKFFDEAMYWLLSGCGIGFRVLPKDIDQLPDVIEREKGFKHFEIKDSIEGWSEAIEVLMSSYFSDQYASRPEYSGYKIMFDYSKIRKKGTLIADRFKAPGHQGLKNSIEKIEALIEDRMDVCKEQSIACRLRPIDVYDIVMHMSDAVLSGGVRRSATICLFHHQDLEMLNAKTGNWFTQNPQRARSNNSAMLIRGEVTRAEFKQVMKSVRDWGEPGFVWTDSYDIIFNPCVEIGMRPMTESGVSGWQGCNLTEINGGQCSTKELFLRACKASAILGTLQAGYTNFKYVKKETRQIFEREALLGCSITGFTNNPEILFNEEIQREGAELIKEINKEVASLIGINPAARTTCVKPSGNASVLLGTASGIHGEHHKKYFRQVQVNKTEDIPQFIKNTNPEMFEDSVWSSTNSDWVVSFPIETNEKSIFKSDLIGVKQLELVKLTQQNWVEAGTNHDLCVVPNIRHNVSNTIEVNDWDEVEEYIYENRQYFAGISLLANTGDKDYAQAPFVAVHEPDEILKEYGQGTLFASGLIVDGLHAFGNNLWTACDTVLSQEILPANSDNALKIDWIRRFHKFSESYLNGDLKKTSYLLKDVYNYHKWVKINRNIIDLDWENLDIKPEYADMDTMGSAACAGGACEIQF
jgi:ribonucleoside-triphosphate reductase (thioredoxin)